MFRVTRRFLHPNARNRRILSSVLGAFLLAALTFSGVFVAVEADHDCHGPDCAVCLELQHCLGACQLIGSASAPAVDGTPAVVAAADEFVPHARRAPTTTLRSLDVRFDE